MAWDRCQQYVGRGVSGVFFTPLELTPGKDAANARITAAFNEAGIPIVLLDRPVQPYGRREDHDLVGIDNRRAGYRITEHLLRAGSRRLAFASLLNAAPTVDARRAGYREALHEYGAPVEAGLSVAVDPGDKDRVGRFMVREHPDGIVCANDRTAALVMQTLLSLGCAIPGDVRLVGIDDVPYAGLLPIPLTTLRQPCREIGAAAMAAMLDRVARPDLPPRDIFLHPTLIVRASCGTHHA
jgi:DNA-binding LacI/PurR family transcriptional regulator